MEAERSIISKMHSSQIKCTLTLDESVEDLQEVNTAVKTGVNEHFEDRINKGVQKDLLLTNQTSPKPVPVLLTHMPHNLKKLTGMVLEIAETRTIRSRRSASNQLTTRIAATTFTSVVIRRERKLPWKRND